MQILLKGTLIILSLGNLFTVSAQVNYRAGFAKTSLEPLSYPFSLTLAGYGAPRDGRFTLEWIKKGEAGGCTAFGSIANDLLAVRQRELMTASAVGTLSWNSRGKADNILLLAGSEAGVFSVDKAGNIFYAVSKPRWKWKKIGVKKNAVAIAVMDSTIYAAEKGGAIRYASLKKKALSWKQLTELSDIQSLTAYKGALYALTVENDLLKLDLGKEYFNWIKIARYNGVSYDVKLKAIAIANNTLYGIDTADAIYTGQHRTEGNLSVTALAVASGSHTVILVGADVCGFDYNFISSVKEEVFRKNNIPATAILINASHTHFAPVTQNWLTWGEHNQQPDSVYLNDAVRPAIITAIETAIQNMEPSKVYFGRGKTAIGGNRAFSSAPFPYDDDVDILSIVREKDKEKTVIFLAGCHPVFKNEGAEGITISPNYPGVTRKYLAEKAGISKSLFMQGCGGDINPVDKDHVITGNNLAADIMAVLNKPMTELQGDISFYLDSVNLPVKPWTKEALIAFKNKHSGKEGDVYAEKNIRWANLMLHLYQKNKILSSMPVYIQTIHIGQWKLVGLSREAVADYSIGIKKIWPGKLVSVAGYCNDVSSYLPAQRHIQEGRYEGLDSFFWYGQPSVFPESVYDKILEKVQLE